MKRSSVILALALVGIWMLADLVRDSIEALRYFSSQPDKLLYVAAIAIVGGLVALGFDRLPSRAKRQIKIIVSGVAASMFTAIAIYFAICFVQISSLIGQFPNLVWVFLLPFILAGLAIYYWFQFFRALKAGVQ